MFPHTGSSSGPTPNDVFELGSSLPCMALLCICSMRQNLREGLPLLGCYVSVKAVDMGTNGNIFYFSIFRENKLILILNKLTLRKFELYLK